MTTEPTASKVETMLALLFPGQGSHTPFDRAEVVTHAPELLDRCIELMGEDPFPKVEVSTAFAQPAIFLTSIARSRAAELPAAPALFAGHSLGEIGALVAAGALSLHDGLRLVVERGRLMGQAKAGAMVAMRADADQVRGFAASHGWVLANDNAPGQVVVAGFAHQRDAVIQDAVARGLTAVALNVTGAFHSPLMSGAGNALRDVLDAIDFKAPIAPVFCCATAAPFTDPQRQLAEALTAPVRWRELLLALQAAGATSFADVGPGRVIDGLTRRTLPQATRVKVVADVAV